MKFRPPIQLLAGLLCLFEATAAPATEPGQDWHPADYVALAWENHPSLQAAAAAIEAGEELEDAADAWPQPRLEYSFFPRPVETALGPQEHRLALMQSIPWPGKLESSRRAASHRVASLNASQRSAVLDIQESVLLALAASELLAREIEIEAAQAELLRDQEELAQVRWRNGGAEQGDLLRLQVESGRTMDRLRRLRRARTLREADLNRALGRAASSPLPWPIHLPAATHPATNPAMLETTQNPGLEKLREDADGHQARAESIRKDARPDLGVGISTILVGEDSISGAPESGRDAWMAILSMRLPLWGGGYDERARAALAQRRESEAKRADLMLALENGMERQIFEYEDARDRLNLHQEELIPRQREALRAIMTSWQNGRAELTTFLEGSRLYLSLEREAARARHDLHRAAARAATLSGSAIAPINPEDSSEDFSENFSENSSEKRTRP